MSLRAAWETQKALSQKQNILSASHFDDLLDMVIVNPSIDQQTLPLLYNSTLVLGNHPVSYSYVLPMIW